MSEAAFLGAICATPDDDTVRLAFADWLDEHDRPARAEFIRAQVELARTDEADANYPALLARSRRSGLFTNPALRFPHETAPGAKVMFRRGFVSGVEIAPADLLAIKSARFDQLPLEQLRLRPPASDAKGTGKKLAKRRELAKLHTLALGYGWETSDLLPLLSSPQLANLRALALSRSHGEQHSLRDVIAGLATPKLDSLNLDLGMFGRRAWEDEDGNRHEEPLEDWNPYLPKKPLRRLHLDGYSENNGDWEWPGPSFGWLAGTKHWKALEVANVRFGIDHISTGHYVQPAPPGNVLKRLAGSKLKRLLWDGYETDALCAQPDWGAVEELALHGGFYSDTISKLANAAPSTALRGLTLDGGAHGSGTASAGFAAAVLGADPWPNLRRLSFRLCPAELLKGAFCAHLLRLDLGYLGYYVPQGPLAKLVASADLRELRHLTLGHIDDGNVGFALEPLYTATNLPNLCTLTLVSDGMPPLVLDRLASNKHLPHLSLVGVGRYGAMTQWWVMGAGKANPISPDVIPVDEDWCEPDPFADWFW